MAPVAITPDQTSGTTTPTTPTTVSALTQAGISHQPNTKTSPLAPLSAANITYNLIPAGTGRPVPARGSDEERAQKTCTDHMILASWTAAAGWANPVVQAYGPLSIMPSASVLHYATECFEGLKLYRGHDGKLRLFRPRRNAERMRRSAARIALPDFEAAELEKMILALCAVDGAKWLPDPGHFLYVRPTMISNDPALGVQRPKEALLYVILACFPDMSINLAPPVAETANGHANGNGVAEKKPSGLRLLASNEDTIRAWPGGFGYAKLGANYGPTLVAQGEARARGFDQVLWLFGKEGHITEAGASNLFVVWKSKETGKLELVTAPLEERIILEGVTRASVLELARKRLAAEGVEVVEKRFTMGDLIDAYREDRLLEVFAAGTAFFIAPVALIHFRGQDINLPSESEKDAYAPRIKQWLSDIMYGKVSHEWGVVVEELN